MVMFHSYVKLPEGYQRVYHHHSQTWSDFPSHPTTCMDWSLFFVASSVCRCMRWISFCASSRSSLAASWRYHPVPNHPVPGTKKGLKQWEHRHETWGKPWGKPWKMGKTWGKPGISHDLMTCHESKMVIYVKDLRHFIHFHEFDGIWRGSNQEKMGISQRGMLSYQFLRYHGEWMLTHKREIWIKKKWYFEQWTWTFLWLINMNCPTPSTPRDEWLTGSVSRPPSVEAPRYLCRGAAMGQIFNPSNRVFFPPSKVQKTTGSFENDMVDSDIIEYLTILDP